MNCSFSDAYLERKEDLNGLLIKLSKIHKVQKRIDTKAVVEDVK